MKRLRQIFKVSLAKIFFVLNFVICAVVFDWKEFFDYLEMPMRVNCHFKESGGSLIDFSVYGMYGSSYGYGTIESFLYVILVICSLFLSALFLILVFPSIAITQITLGMLKTSFPFWCYETHQIIHIPVFAVINSFYWVCLAHIIELSYSQYVQLPSKNKYIGIFKDF